jgi:gamma-glutamyl hercynylcysteine S-oxide synthase
MPDDHRYETPRILSDAPLRDSDAAHFHFDQFAATLARLIADKGTRTPLTIGVSGAWGSGKTTLLKRIQKQLDETLVRRDPSKPELLSFVNADEETADFRICRTVWFNAWKYADESELLVALVRVITQEMFKDDLISKGAAALLEPFTPRRDVINTVLGWFSIKVGDATVGVNTGTAVETPFAEKTALLDLFNDVFDRLMAAWVHRSLEVQKIDPEKGVLVVFIDDLDRCLPKKTVQVLESIKLFLDKEGCVFVLGADTEIIREAVETYYQNEKVTGQNAADYLDKIVQLRFDLPPVVPETMQAYLKTQEVGAEMLAQWQTLIAAAAINPRRVKVVFNEIELQWKMLVNSGQAQDEKRPDFIRWSALWRAAPEAFREKVRDFENLDHRLDFVKDSLNWGLGTLDEAKKSAFADYEKKDGRRLRNVLHEIKAFSADFDAKTLDAFMHLNAPPQKVVPVEVQQPVEPVETIPAAQPVESGPTAPIHFGFEPELDEVRVKDVIRGGEPPAATGRFPPASDDKRMTIGGIEFVKIPKGRFLMGSKEDNQLAYDDEKPQHTVEIVQDYWLARFPVTNEQYAVYSGEKKHPVAGWQKKKDHPVGNVSWNNAMNFCQWFNVQYKSELGQLILRLPTEAEWEKAARGEYGNKWPWGNEFGKNKCNSAEGKKGGTTPIGTYSPQGDSPYGCGDMAGNVWEWCADWYAWDTYQRHAGQLVTDPAGPPSGSARVLRGGAWLNDSSRTCCASRLRSGPSNFDALVGFRVVCSPITL